MADNKTLRVCLAQELPEMSERDTSYLYLAYDKLLLFFGQNPYYDPYVICEALPSNPITGCLYILFDGTVQVYVDGDTVTIAEIEDSSQAEHLKDLGNTFFVMADKRYLDLQRKTLQLPYQNGTYSLSVAMAKDIKINEKSVIRYDGVAQRFYLDGEYDVVPRLYPFIGKNTQSVEVQVNDHCIHADVRISEKSGNILSIVNGGLFADVGNIVTVADFEELLETYEEYKDTTDSIITAMESYIGSSTELITTDTLYDYLLEALKEYDDDLKGMIDYYASLTDELAAIEANSKAYTDETFDETQSYLENVITESLQALWGEF